MLALALLQDAARLNEQHLRGHAGATSQGTLTTRAGPAGPALGPSSRKQPRTRTTACVYIIYPDRVEAGPHLARSSTRISTC